MPLSDLLQKNRDWAAAQLARDPEFFALLARDGRVEADEYHWVYDLGTGLVKVVAGSDT
ncbi:MAG: hypothetical protein HY705_09660 [Gemmatimonadetes bacterium]|nr:hypothetical protein [Gemmatimonadota bacterium]